MSNRQEPKMLTLSLRGCRQRPALYDHPHSKSELDDCNAGKNATTLQNKLYEITARPLNNDGTANALITLLVPSHIFDKLDEACRNWSSAAAEVFSQRHDYPPQNSYSGVSEAAEIFEQGPRITMTGDFEVMASNHPRDLSEGCFTTARVTRVQKLEIDGVDALEKSVPDPATETSQPSPDA